MENLSDFSKQFVDATLLASFQYGATPNDIRDSILELFSPYINNRQYFEDQSWRFLIQDGIEFQAIVKDNRANGLFKKSLEMHRNAKIAYSNESLTIQSQWITPIYESGKRSVSWAKNLLSESRNDMDDAYDLVYMGYKDIGVITEGISKPLIFELYHQSLLAKGKERKFDEINVMNFGTIVNEMVENDGMREFYVPSPWGLTIVEWRNIAKHDSWEIQDDEIINTYGVKKDKQIVIKINELKEITNYLLMLTTAMLVSHRVFHIDNIEESYNLGLLPKELSVRKESKLLEFRTQLAANGFDLEDYSDSKEEFVADVRNVLFESDDDRRIKLFGMAAFLGKFVESQNVVIVYYGKDGSINYEVKYSRQILNNFYDGGINMTISNLITNAEFEDKKHTS